MRLILSLFLILSFSILKGQDCPVGDVTFECQSELDSFKINFPDCKIIEGSLRLLGDINNLNGLQHIKTIQGSLIIRNLKNLETLAGLESLTQLGDGFHVEQNESLISFGGLDNLIKVAAGSINRGQISIINNPALISIEAIDGILDGNVSIKGPLHLDIKDNPALTSISAFGSLTSLQTMEIINNQSLESLEGLENIENITEKISVINNSNIKDFRDLANLERTYKGVTTFEIADNESLETLDGLGQFNFSWLNKLLIHDNPNLNACESNKLCLLFLEKDSTHYEIYNNGSGCNIGDLEPPCEDALKQCLPGSLTLNWASESFTEYSDPFPFCEEILGSLTFQSTQSYNNSIPGDGFLQLKKLHGNLTMTEAFGRTTTSINLDGFNNLEWIGGSVNIRGGGNFNGDGTFTSSGFKSLERINGNLTYLSDDNGTMPFKDGALDALSNIKYVGGNLTIGGRIGGDFSQLTNMAVNGSLVLRNRSFSPNTTTTSIAGIGEMDLSQIGSLSITGFESVNFCSYPNICAYLAAGGNATIGGGWEQSNGQGCNSIAEILNLCQNNLGSSKFYVFIDENRNKVFDSNEKVHETSRLEFLTQGYEVFNGEDGFTFFAGNGDYEVRWVEDSNWELTTDSPSLSFSHDSIGLNGTYYFGIAPLVEVTDADAAILTHEIRCAFWAKIQAIARNTGTTPISGTLWFELDSNIDQTRIIDQPDFQNGNLLGWQFENLHAGGRVIKELEIFIPGPGQLPVGSQISFNSYIEIKNGTSIGHFEHTPVIACAYDPNDKLVSPSHPFVTQEPVDTVFYSQLDQDLIYTVRFQNTGNADALKVVVRDTLDSNLDWSSFEFLSSSHSDKLTTTIKDGRFVTFTFNEIYLPPKDLDNSGSQGYLSYAIKPKGNLVEETLVTNTAHIYFDNNPAIITNTTENIMVSELPEISSSQNIDNQLNLNIFPNPTDGKIYLQGENLLNAKVTVSDVTGRFILIEKLNGTNEIQLPKNISGLLLLKIETEDGVAVKRVFRN